MIEEALTLWREADSFAAIEFLNQQEPETAVLAAYDGLLALLYWQERALEPLVVVGRAGLQFGLDAGHRRARRDIPGALALRGEVARLAYNLASYTWPGWAEPGLRPGPRATAVGLDAARLYLRLALELDRDAAGMARAYDLLGRHLLAARAHEGALGCFRRAALYAKRAELEAEQLLAAGYGALARLRLDERDDAAQEALNEALERLAAADGDGPAYAAQLATAVGYFLPRPTDPPAA